MEAVELVSPCLCGVLVFVCSSDQVVLVFPAGQAYDGLMTHPCLASAKLAEGLDSSATGELQATFRCLEGSETLAAALLGAALARGEGIVKQKGITGLAAMMWGPFINARVLFQFLAHSFSFSPFDKSSNV